MSYSHFYKAMSTTYAYRGSSCGNGFNCGFTYVYLYYSGSAGWTIGAALSFK